MTPQEKFDYVMHEWKQGKLHDGHGKIVPKDKQDQAIAIAYSEARKIDSKFGNPVSLDEVKRIVKTAKDNPDLNIKAGTFIFKVDQKLVDDIVIKSNQGKSPEQIWMEIEDAEKEAKEHHKTFEKIKKGKITTALELGESISEEHKKQKMENKPGKLTEYAEKNKPSKLKKADVPSVEEELEKEKKIKENITLEEKPVDKSLDVKESFIENRDMYIVLTQDSYKKFIVAEIKEYGQKMPFGKATRSIGTEHIFYYSDKLKKLLDSNKIYYSLLEERKELIEYLEKLK